MGHAWVEDGQGLCHLRDLDHFQVELSTQTLAT